jgi:hypothetical protein
MIAGSRICLHPTPKVAERRPDLSGIWMSARSRFDISQGLKAGETVPFQPAARTLFSERRASN